MSIDLETLQEMWEKDAKIDRDNLHEESLNCLLYTSPSPRDPKTSRMPSSA